MMPVLTPREEIISLYSDTYKDAYGYRPRNHNLAASTDEELLESIKGFCKVAEDNAEAEAKFEAAQAEKFKAMINKYINEFGAADETQALQWYIDSLDEKFYNQQCVELIIYRESFLYTEYGKSIVQKICAIIQANNAWESYN